MRDEEERKEEKKMFQLFFLSFHLFSFLLLVRLPALVCLIGKRQALEANLLTNSLKIIIVDGRCLE